LGNGNRNRNASGNWTTILEWLQKEPDVTASSLLERLRAAQPEKYADDKTLRTLQRRIGQWQCIMAKQLVVGTTWSFLRCPPLEGDDAAIGLLRYAQQPNGSILFTFVISVTSGAEAKRSGNIIDAEQKGLSLDR